MQYWLARLLAVVCLVCAPTLCRSDGPKETGENAPHSSAPQDRDNAAKKQDRVVDVDDAADEERLNRELWESIKGLPYAAAKEHIARGQREAPFREALAVLPNGWKLAPAGIQVPVGRLP